MYIALLTLCAFFLGGCAPRYTDFFPYHDNGTKKPFVSLLPMYDTVESKASDMFSKELISQVRNELMSDGTVYCLPVALDVRVLDATPLDELVHTTDLGLFKRFQKTDFVVVTELLEYKIVPYKRQTTTPLYVADIPDEAAKVIKIAVRLNIIDNRPNSPKHVRQEIIRSNHMVPKDESKVNYAMVHSRLSRDLKEKIEITVSIKK